VKLLWTFASLRETSFDAFALCAGLDFDFKGFILETAVENDKAEELSADKRRFFGFISGI